MEHVPWDQRVARRLVRPLVGSPVRPDHITLVSLALSLAGAGLFAAGGAAQADWGAGIFVLGRFLDHFDGELARQQGTTSKAGYYYDYLAGALSYAALYLGLGIGLMESALGSWALGLGIAGAVASVISLAGNVAQDRETGGDETGDAVGYPGLAGLELEDGMYLIAPATWIGWLTPFFAAAAAGAVVYALVVCWQGVRAAGRTATR